jgi:hypothetical protein
MLNETEESATLIDIERWAKLKDHPALNQLQPVLGSDGPDGGQVRGFETVRVRRLTEMNRKRDALIFNPQAYNLLGLYFAQGGFQRRAVDLGFGRDLDLIARPPFQAVVAHIDQPWKVNAIPDVHDSPARDNGYQREVRLECVQQLTVAWRDLGRLRIIDDRADGSIQIRDKSQAKLADDALQRAGHGGLPVIRFFHGFIRSAHIDAGRESTHHERDEN